MSEGIVLRYIGAGAYITGVPACDLTQEQIDASGYTVGELLAYNSATQPLYELVKE